MGEKGDLICFAGEADITPATDIYAFGIVALEVILTFYLYVSICVKCTIELTTGF